MIETSNKVITGSQVEALYVGCRYIKNNQWFPIQKITWEKEDGEYCNIKTIKSRARVMRPCLAGQGIGESRGIT